MNKQPSWPWSAIQITDHPPSLQQVVVGIVVGDGQGGWLHRVSKQLNRVAMLYGDPEREPWLQLQLELACADLALNRGPQLPHRLSGVVSLTEIAVVPAESPDAALAMLYAQHVVIDHQVSPSVAPRVQFRVVEDRAHSWYGAPAGIVRSSGVATQISSYSRYDATAQMVYLECDFDAPLVFNALRQRGVGVDLMVDPFCVGRSNVRLLPGYRADELPV